MRRNFPLCFASTQTESRPLRRRAREKERERKREFSKFCLRNATRTGKRTENMPIQVQWIRKHEGNERMTRRAHLEEPSSTYTFSSFLTKSNSFDDFWFFFVNIWAPLLNFAITHREKSELLKREQRVRERGAPTNKTQEVSQSKTVKLPLLCCSIIPPTRSSSYKSSNESSKLRNPLCVCDGNAYPRLVIQERKNEEKYKKNWNLQKEEEIKKGWRMVLL
jgi:hypothetical protein